MAVDVTEYLKAAPTDDNTRAEAWEAFNHSASQEEFNQRVGGLKLPQEVKAGLWEARFGSGKLPQVSAPAAQATTPPANPAPKEAPPQPKPSLGQRLWDWANKPFGFAQPTLEGLDAINKGVITPEVAKRGGQTLQDTKDALKTIHEGSPYVGAAKQALAGMAHDAGDMIMTPMSAGLTALGALVGNPEAGALTKTNIAARAALAGAGTGFGAKGVGDIIMHLGAQQGEDTGAHVKRILTDAAMVAGGVGGVHEALKLPKLAKGVPSTPAAAVPKQTVEQAQARVNEAVGKPTAPKAVTVHVDPDVAAKIQQWDASDLPGKRIVAKTTKGGKNQLSLAHVDPENPGYQYTEKKLPFADEGDQKPGQVPVQLSQTNGVRGTSIPGHFLAWKIGEGDISATGPAPTPTPALAPEAAESAATPKPRVEPIPQMPIAGPETGLESIGGPSPVVPQPKSSAAPPEAILGQNPPASEPTPEAQPTGGVRPGVNPLPDDLSKASPRYAYGRKNFELSFEDPHDLAAYTLGQTKDNAAQGKFVDYLKQEYPGITKQDALAHRQKVRDTIKELAKNANPDEGPLTVPSHGGIEIQPKIEEKTVVPADAARGVQEVKLPTVEKPTEAPKEPEPVKPVEPPKPAAPEPSVEPTPEALKAEGPVRKLAGAVMRLKQLRQGETVNHAIDRAITNSRAGQPIPEDTLPVVRKLLGEEPANTLTHEQIGKLESIRGAQPADEPEIKYYSTKEYNRATRHPQFGEQFEDAVMQSRMAAFERSQDPNLSPEKQKFYSDLANSDKYFTMEKGLKYPEPKDLPEDHPEAPFAKKAFGHRITGINTENLKAALGVKSMRNIFSGTSAKDPMRYVTEEEQAKLKTLYDATEAASIDKKTSDDRFYDLIGRPGEDADAAAAKHGAHIIVPKDVNPEFAEFHQKVAQNALDRRIAETEQALKDAANKWHQARGQAKTPLTDQLDNLPDDVKKLLPGELFSREQAPTAKASTPTETAPVKEPVKSTNATPKRATTLRPGAATSQEGVRYTKWDVNLSKTSPDAMKHLPVIHQAVADGIKDVAKRQEAYARASKTYHDAVLNNDPFALKQAVDTIVRPGEAGYVQLGKGTGPYTADQNHAINAAAADKILERWEGMTKNELVDKRNGLWGNIQDRIDETVPVSQDPAIRLQQAMDHADLKARLDALKEQAGHSPHLWDRFRDWFHQQELGREAQQLLRDGLGKQRRDTVLLKKQFELMDKMMDSLPIAEQDRFYHRMMTGELQEPAIVSKMDPKLVKEWTDLHGTPPDVHDFADQIRQALDNARDKVFATTGDLKDFIVNYMPGLYENVGKTRSFAEQWSHRPLAGSSDFLKQKYHEFYEDALNAGLQPRTANPVRAAMMRIDQLNRYVMGHQFKNNLVDRGLADWYGAEETPPQGWHKLNDRVFGGGGLGNYWAPEGVAKSFNNFVSQGFTGKWKVPFTQFSLYDAARTMNNSMNLMQLGFSAFHGVEMGFNSMFTALSVAGKQGIEGVRTGNVKMIAKGVGNLAKSMTIVGPVIEDTYFGARGLAAFADPVKNLDYAQLASDLESANANVRTDPIFHLNQIDRFKRNFDRATDDLRPITDRAKAATKAGFNLLGATTEAFGAPLMNGLVPRVKAGAFYRMAQEIHERMAGEPPDAIQGELQKAWDSVDNRFGEVNYDNWFMNKSLKDIMMLTIRSVGWTGGTVREIGGGLLDAAGNVGQAMRGEKINISHRTAYTAALTLGTMYINAVYQYLHTGTFAHGIDFFFPKDGSKDSNGEDNRMYPKDYIYDFINVIHDPLTTGWHKAAPSISVLSDLIRNEDYYHHQIKDPGAGVVANTKSSLGYLAKQYIPFSASNYLEANLRGQGRASRWEATGGILPAPKWVGRSAAENLAFQYFQGTKPSGPMDDSQFEKKKEYILLKNKVNTGQLTDDDLNRAMEQGKINPKMVKYLYATRSQPELVTWVKRLESPQQIWNVWKAASPAEKQMLLPIMYQKMGTMTSGDDLENYMTQLGDYSNSH